MNKNDELDALLMLIRAMSGEEKVIEHMEAEGQRDAIRYTRMARRMNPEREEWEKLGFSFIDIPGDSILLEAQMPEGWSMKATDHSMWTDICDNNGLLRGQMFYKAAFYDRDAHMFLERRYNIHTDYLDEDYNIEEVYFGSKDEKLFVAGIVSKKPESTREERMAFYEERERLEEVARQWANENYPDWQDIHAYWDKGPVKSFKPSDN